MFIPLWLGVILEGSTPNQAELQVAGKAAAAALQNVVYELLSEHFQTNIKSASS